MGFEIANVTAPTRRTFHSCAGGVLLSVSIMCSQFLLEITVPRLYHLAHLAGSIAVTLIVSPLIVPVTFTFCPANSSGFFWSES